MDNYLDFTSDPVRFPMQEWRAFTQQLHSEDRHYIIIVDPGISTTTPNYAPLDSLLASQAYVREYGSDTPILGKVWPGYTYFPDFFHPNGTVWWGEQIASFREQGPEFDGLWIDMNELASWCNAQCNGSNGDRSGKQSRSLEYGYNNPPYVPGGISLDVGTINMSAQQYPDLVMYNTHSMYGWSMGIATKNVLEAMLGKRSVVIGRSTFAGSGAHSSHWLGDNWSNFTDMYYSIPGVLSFQMFGIPQVGADICGEGGNTTEQLCTRWMQLGTLYPFARSHNEYNSIPQEPWAFSSVMLDVSRDAIVRRYTLLPYLYTLFAGAHYNGTTVWRPLFFEFPVDFNTYAIDRQFMIGKHLLVTPVLLENATTVTGYFPDGVWYDYYNYSALPSMGCPSNIVLDAPITKIPIHIRGGSIIPMQEPAANTRAARQLPFTLVVALDDTNNAEGEIYLDDGETIGTMESLNFTYVRYEAKPYSNQATILSNDIIFSEFEPAEGALLARVNVLGVPQAPGKVTLNGNAAQYDYNTTNQVLYTYGLNVKITDTFELVWD